MKLTMHEKNTVRAVFEAPQPTRRSIADDAGVSLVVVTAAVKSLTEKNPLTRTQLPQERSGRPEFTYHLANSLFHTIGVSVAPDSFHVVAMGTDKQVILDHFEPLDTSSDSPSQAGFLDRVTARVRDTIDTTPELRENLVSIGITLPGLINSTEGIWLNGLQIPGIHQFDVGSYLQAQFDIPYVIEDVSRALTYYEKTAGSGVGLDHFVLLSLGLGTGSGIVINGELYQGFNGLAGEIGHTVVQPNGHLDIAGMAGTLETVASVSGVQRLFRYRLAAGVASSLQDGGNGRTLSIEQIAQAACSGDRLTKGILFEIGGYVGEACTKIIKLFNPRKLVVSGPVSTLREHMEDAIRQTIDHKVLPEMLSGFTLEFAQYEPNQEAQGMALLAMSRYLGGAFLE